MDNKILLRFGLPRTGSTLIFNILGDVFPDKQIINSHNLFASAQPLPKNIINNIHDFPIIISFREPRDILVSLLRIRNRLDNITKNDIDDCIARYTFEETFSQTYDWYKMHNTIFLIYEKFYNDFDYIFDKLEQFFKININKNRRDELKKKYNVLNLKNLADSMDNFSQWDKKTMIHGQHISAVNGEINQWKHIIPIELRDYCTKKLKCLIDFHRQCMLDPTL